MPTDFQMRVRKRMAQLGISANAASMRAGLSRETVRKLLEPEAGLPRGSTLAKLARALETTEAYFLNGDVSEAPPPEEAPRELTYADDDAVEIKAVAAGSYEGAFHLFESAMGQAPLPRGLRKYPDVYAIVIINESMVPEHRPGALRFVTPTVKPRIGDSVVVEFEKDPDLGPEAMIGHLLQNSATIRIGKLNPKGEVAIDARSVRRLHRLAPEAEVSATR